MGTLNETQAIKFMQGGEVTDQNCIIIQDGILECLDPLTRSYSLAK
jgi:hypothetical protein